MLHLVTSNAKEKEKENENAVMEPCKKYLAGHIRVLNSAAAVECGISTLAVLNNCVRCDLFVLATYDRFTFNPVCLLLRCFLPRCTHSFAHNPFIILSSLFDPCLCFDTPLL